MSDAKTPRTKPEIDQEFTTVCTKLGFAEFQIYLHSKDVEMFRSQLRDLNFEAIEAEKARKALAAEATPSE